jgi:hypothetical protein
MVAAVKRILNVMYGNREIFQKGNMLKKAVGF